MAQSGPAQSTARDEVATTGALQQSVESRSLWKDAWRRLRRNRTALSGAFIIVLFVLVALAAPLVAPYDPVEQNYEALLEGPSLRHPFGTDNFGRDIFSRIIWGARISLRLGFFGTLVGVVLGIAVGLSSGYYGRWVDSTLMRLLDIQLALPGLLLAVTIIAVLGVGEINVIVAIGIFSLPTFARVLRGSILSLKQQDFVLAARAVGVPDRRIMLAHLLPNAIAPIMVIATLRLGSAILTAASLSFLGLGIRPPAPEWGAMLSDARNYLQLAPHVAIFPGLAILLSVLALNLLGDGLRDALDPRLKTADQH
jgi:ABC-type dipeptide/oligopeptide/nickel transport system permease subunit